MGALHGIYVDRQIVFAWRFFWILFCAAAITASLGVNWGALPSPIPFLLLGSAWSYFEQRSTLPTQNVIGLVVASFLTGVLCISFMAGNSTHWWESCLIFFLAYSTARGLCRLYLHRFRSAPYIGLMNILGTALFTTLLGYWLFPFQCSKQVLLLFLVALIFGCATVPLWVDKRGLRLNPRRLPAWGWMMLHLPVLGGLWRDGNFGLCGGVLLSMGVGAMVARRGP